MKRAINRNERTCADGALSWKMMALMSGMFGVLAVGLAGADPGWWRSWGAVNSNPPNDYAYINEGQLKAFTAAVLGATFRLDDAAEMLGESPATLLPAVQEAMDAAVITAAEDTFVFRHQLRAGSHLLCSAYPGDSASLAGLDHAAEQTLRSAPQTAELQALAGLRDPLAGLAAGAVLATPGRPGSPATTAALVTRASVAWDHGRDQARVRRRLRHLGIRRRHWATTAAARPVTGWDSLTGTEQAVARLVAEGLNNGQVAARMYISPHTVAHHLRQAFRKLTISSRVELTRIVIEHAADDADLAERNHKQGGPR